MPIPYQAEQPRIDLDRYFALWDATRTRLAEQFGHPLRLEVEPGRYLVAESGCLIAEVRAVKRQGENLSICSTPASTTSPGRSSMGPIIRCPSPRATATWRGRSQEVIVGGPLCESGDVFTQEEGGFVVKRSLPAATVGDFLVIECAGAYGFTMGSNYNSKPLAAEILVQNGQAHLIRRRQTFDDLVRGESIPG